MNENPVLPALSRIVADALSVAPERVTREARIFGDLGAESIDLLDIQFRMEHEFGLTLNVEDIPGSSGELSTADLQDQLTVGALEDFLKYRLASRVDS